MLRHSDRNVLAEIFNFNLLPYLDSSCLFPKTNFWSRLFGMTMAGKGHIALRVQQIATEMGEMRLGAGCDAETLSLAPLLYAGVHIPIAICDWQQALSRRPGPYHTSGQYRYHVAIGLRLDEISLASRENVK